ncbi:MAG: LamG-like jellyroll fold domain-containing protein [Ferruginibacter sp.]
MEMQITQAEIITKWHRKSGQWYNYLSYVMTWCSANIQTGSGYKKDTGLINSKWITVAYVYSGDEYKMYHNCEVVNQWMVYPKVSDLCGTEPMQISLGNVPTAAMPYGHRPFKGKMDELRIYKRALTEEEVAIYSGSVCKITAPVITPDFLITGGPCSRINLPSLISPV